MGENNKRMQKAEPRRGWGGGEAKQRPNLGKNLSSSLIPRGALMCKLGFISLSSQRSWAFILSIQSLAEAAPA